MRSAIARRLLDRAAPSAVVRRGLMVTLVVAFVSVLAITTWASSPDPALQAGGSPGLRGEPSAATPPAARRLHDVAALPDLRGARRGGRAHRRGNSAVISRAPATPTRNPPTSDPKASTIDVTQRAAATPSPAPTASPPASTAPPPPRSAPRTTAPGFDSSDGFDSSG
jgi:hypothetical protein